LKSLWEITSKTAKYPIGLQVKQGRPYAIRPYAFHKKPNDSFADIHAFVNAIYNTRKMFVNSGMIDPDEWREKVISALI
jgi:hypothetical protein